MAKQPDGALLPGHLSHQHPDHVGLYLDRMRGTEDISMVAAQAFDAVAEDETQGGHAKSGSMKGDGTGK
jgi:hypothetical protein